MKESGEGSEDPLAFECLTHVAGVCEFSPTMPLFFTYVYCICIYSIGLFII